jgi:hypothetical protein
MKLTFKISGGFAYIPALSRPVIIDTAQIDPQVANQLESLVQESRFFDQPATINTVPKGAADYRTYTITVEEGSRAHTIELTDPITDANLERLVSFLEGMSRPLTP